jgi:hypothetical protein
MTQAYNLSQLANNLNSSGQLDATDGLVNSVPVANGGTGASSASAARNNLDVPSTTGGGASGTWGINISGNAATATSATNATNAINATNATNAINATTAASCSGNSATATKLTTASGSAPSYSARAWVTFNSLDGTILASGNVSSVTKQSTGYWIVTFAVAMPNSNYVMSGSYTNESGTGYFSLSMQQSGTVAPSTTQCGIVLGQVTTAFDASTIRAVWFA